jgi:hypothetical protein
MRLLTGSRISLFKYLLLATFSTSTNFTGQKFEALVEFLLRRPIFLTTTVNLSK